MRADGDGDAWKANTVATGLNEGQRVGWSLSLAAAAGASLAAGIASGGEATGTSMHGRFYWKGLLVEDQA